MPAEIDLRGDIVVISHTGGNCELQLKNATRALTGGVLTNIGDGLLAFQAIATTWDAILANGGSFAADRLADLATHKFTFSAGQVVFAASTTARPNINLPLGVAPSSPVTGDLYHVSGHLYFRDGSTTYDLLNAASNWDAVLALGGSFSADRSADFNGHTLTFNNTLIFSNTASFKALQISPIIPSEASQVNFNWTRNTTAQPTFPGNEVVNFGFNVASNATPEVAGKPALFTSMESNYHPSASRLMEWHQEFFNDAGASWRLKSYTINHTGTASPDVDLYFNVSRLYAKAISLPAYIPWSVGDFDTATLFQQYRTASSAHSWSYGTNANLSGNGSAGQFLVSGYAQYTIGSPGMVLVVQGAQTQIIAQSPATGTPLNLNDGSGHSAYLFNGGAHGQITLTNNFLTNTVGVQYTAATSSSNSTTYAGFVGLGDLADGLYALMLCSAYPGFGAATAGMGFIRCAATAGIIIMADGGPITFAVGSNAASGKMFANGNFAWGTTTDVTTAILQVVSTTKGFLPPKMTTTQKNAISSPAEGLIVYDITLHKGYQYDGSAWQALF